MELRKKFAVAALAAVGVGSAFSACADSEFDRYSSWAALGAYAAQESGATDSFEGSKRILRWDIAGYGDKAGSTTLYIFDTAKNEICADEYKLGDVKGKRLSSDCQPTSAYDELQMKSIKIYTCDAANDAAKKDPDSVREVLAFCANTDSYGKKLSSPAPN